MPIIRIFYRFIFPLTLTTFFYLLRLNIFLVKDCFFSFFFDHNLESHNKNNKDINMEYALFFLKLLKFFLIYVEEFHQFYPFYDNLYHVSMHIYLILKKSLMIFLLNILVFLTHYIF